MKLKISAMVFAASVWLMLIMLSSPASAQLLGHNLLGDFGLTSGTQPGPGTYFSALYYRYEGDTIRDKDGNALGLNRGELDVNGYALGLWHVTDRKIFGGNYSFSIWPSATDNALEAPILGLAQSTDLGFGDLYVQPINLGWHKDRADYIAGIGVYAPTGRYEDSAPDNVGLGMWSFELFAGTTIYLDSERTWNFATTAFYETHTEKEGSDVNVGDILTLEGGLGKSFKGGLINVGLAYYAQWKITEDDFGSEGLPLGVSPGRHRGYSVGPEITIPIASKSKLYGFFNARYLWESGVRTSVEGESLVLTLTVPIPSVPLQ